MGRIGIRMGKKSLGRAMLRAPLVPIKRLTLSKCYDFALLSYGENQIRGIFWWILNSLSSAEVSHSTSVVSIVDCALHPLSRAKPHWPIGLACLQCFLGSS